MIGFAVSVLSLLFLSPSSPKTPVKVRTMVPAGAEGVAKVLLILDSLEEVHEVPRPHGVEQRQPPIATEGEEMQMAASIVTPQTLRHDTNPHA
jgi:hypothetical protein